LFESYTLREEHRLEGVWEQCAEKRDEIIGGWKQIA
jgi:hypothetical protein